MTNEGYWRKLINQGLIKFFLLKVLYKDKESYGYRIVKRIEELSEGTCRPTESTIYPALDQLAADGYALVHEISTGAREQSSGLEQISEAVSSMDASRLGEQAEVAHVREGGKLVRQVHHPDPAPVADVVGA